MNKKNAFTLAEILITLSIVGVIAALTMPTLVINYRKEAQAVQIRKFSQELASAIDMFITAEGKTSLASTYIFDAGGVDKFVGANLKTSKTCDSNDKSCFASSYRSISGNTGTLSCSGKSYVLANSAAICITANKKSDVTMVGPDSHLKILMDTNGADGSNTGGRDMFTFYIHKDGQVYGEAPEGKLEDHVSSCKCINGICVGKCGCTDSPFGDGCYTMLEASNWEMNY